MSKKSYNKKRFFFAGNIKSAFNILLEYLRTQNQRNGWIIK